MNKTELLIETSNLLSKIEDRIEGMQREIALGDFLGVPGRHLIESKNKEMIIELRNILSSKEAQRIIKEIKK